jgi:hypothetical protein
MTSLIQDIYTRRIFYPYLFGKSSLFSVLLKSPPSPPSGILPETPSLKSFFSNTVLQPPTPTLQKAILHSSKLRSKTIIDYYKNKGLQWLKRVETKSYPQILRNPTMGCTVELTSKPTLYTVHIDSREAKKIIYRECYF